MKEKIVFTASVFGMLAVIAGAFGAHGLKAVLSAENLAIWHTAVQYQFYHVFAMLFLALLASDANYKWVNLSYYFFAFGILLFSGSLYLLSCMEVLSWNWLIFMGPVTPLGGLLFIAGWVTLGLAAFRNKLN